MVKSAPMRALAAGWGVLLAIVVVAAPEAARWLGDAEAPASASEWMYLGQDPPGDEAKLFAPEIVRQW